MNKVVADLKEYGCNTESAKNRFLGDEEFYLSCVNDVLNDDAYDELKTALTAGHNREAYEAAHTLKGLTAQLGLTSMYDILVPISESLRSGKSDGLLPLYDSLMEEQSKIKRIIRQ